MIGSFCLAVRCWKMGLFLFCSVYSSRCVEVGTGMDNVPLVICWIVGLSETNRIFTVIWFIGHCYVFIADVEVFSKHLLNKILSASFSTASLHMIQCIIVHIQWTALVSLYLLSLGNCYYGCQSEKFYNLGVTNSTVGSNRGRLKRLVIDDQNYS